jgi:hypothetical protein
MAAVSTDATAILRCAPAAIGLPSVLAYACFEARTIVKAFHRTVVPLINQAITDPTSNQYAARALLGTSLKVSLAMSGYTIMAGVDFNADLAVLGSSFTRVYDDLFDNFSDPQLDERLAELFRGESFQPLSATESLLLLLYQAIETTLARPRSDPIVRMVEQMHEFQCMSRRQCDPAIPAPELRAITRGKGGLGATILFALFTPGMSTAEQDVLHEFGDILQLLDDLNDASSDRANGVATEVTTGHCTLSDIAARICQLRRRFRTHYVNANLRRISGTLIFMLMGAAIRQRIDASKSRHPGRPSATRHPTLLFLTRVEHLHPPAEEG